jgi:hypothetical protein
MPKQSDLDAVAVNYGGSLKKTPIEPQGEATVRTTDESSRNKKIWDKTGKLPPKGASAADEEKWRRENGG